MRIDEPAAAAAVAAVAATPVSGACPADAGRRFASTTRLFGATGMQRLWAGRVVVVGVGGVGSWAVEALARSGVGHLTLVDLDQIAESNINRQVHALESTVGAAKVTVMAERVRAISPECDVTAIEAFAEPGDIAAVMPALPHERPTVVIDAIDAVAAKAALIAFAVAHDLPVISCGAAGGRRDPLALLAADLAQTHGDALLASVRARLRREHGFPAAAGGRPFGVPAIFAPGQPQGARPDDPAQTGLRGGAPLACAGYGSIVTVTAAMGLAAASRALDRLLAA